MLIRRSLGTSKILLIRSAKMLPGKVKKDVNDQELHIFFSCEEIVIKLMIKRLSQK